jgi:hypothetical protein
LAGSGQLPVVAELAKRDVTGLMIGGMEGNHGGRQLYRVAAATS